MAFLRSLAVGLSSMTALVAGAYPNPGQCSGNCVGIDPAAIRRDDGQYFRFNSFDTISIFKAPSLAGPWSLQGAAIEGGSIVPFPGNNSLWAPNVVKLGDQYVMYYSVSAGQQQSAIGYATSPSMEHGTWIDHGSTGIETQNGVSDRNAIDPDLFRDPASGKYFMSFGSYWNGIYVVPMNDDATHVADGAEYTNIARWPQGVQAMEASNILYRAPYYYLVVSEGKSDGFNATTPAGQEYKVRVCRSRSVTGPYVGPSGKSCLEVDGAGVILGSHDEVYAPGGQGFLEDPALGTIIYYHYANPIISYEKRQFQFGWNRLVYNGEGWPEVAAAGY